MQVPVRIGSYNILAAVYARPQYYPGTDPAELDWPLRQSRLPGRIMALAADVVCLQEVEEEAYRFLAAHLEGYCGVYAQKAQGRPDGCATFWRNNRVHCTRSFEIYYHDGLGGQDSGHLALLSDCITGFGPIRIVNTHLRWDKPQKTAMEHVGFRQARELLDHCSYDGLGPANCVICGDFNAEPAHPLLQEFFRFGFRDAFGTNPQPTCNPHAKAKRIDYLLHSPDLLAEPQKLMEIDDWTPLPSLEEPSDHLAIVAKFSRR